MEDQQPTADAIREGLPPNFGVLTAATVADGVELLMAAAIDVGPLDCVLPGETAWQIALEADRQNVPVVLMTGDRAQKNDATQGARPFILKPFRISELARVLKEAVCAAI